MIEKITTEHESVKNEGQKRFWMRLLFLAVFSIAHAFLTVLTISQSLSYWDRSEPHKFKQALHIIQQILEFPVLFLSKYFEINKYFPGLFGWTLFLLNSLVWGLAIWRLLEWFGKSRFSFWASKSDQHQK